MAPLSIETRTEATSADEEGLPKLTAQPSPRKYEIVYWNVFVFSYGYIAMLYGLYLALTTASWKSLVFHQIIYVLAMLGVTAGAHRLWCHRAYKAKMPLQIILMVMNTLAFEGTAIYWIREHRMHHKYSDTDADPHNATRGFFYSHVGWLLVKKHPEVKRRGKFIDMSDIHANPVLTFQKKYAIPFIGTVCFALPTLIPMYCFGETLNTAWNINIMRYVFNLQNIFLVNSAAHLWGNKPYEINMNPVQSLPVSAITFGEGFHNYHHTFPWDYRAAELGNNWLNFCTKFIDFFAWIGWAYDLKSVPEDLIRSRAKRTGDGSNMWGFHSSVKVNGTE